MEYYSNDLKQVLEAGVDGTDQKEHFKTILYNILCGINFIHSAGVMHRDIKPANILLKSDCSIKFCDFGLSRSCASSTYGTDLETITSKMSTLNQEKPKAGGNEMANYLVSHGSL